MEESPVPNSQYALQLALQTMKERCVQLQKRVANLEEENLALKLKTAREEIVLIGDNDNSLELHEQVAKLSEEKKQLRNTIAMVAGENKQLWSNLSKLTNENKHLGSKISRISDTLSQHGKTHTPLIRSRTFTQEAPHTKHLQKVLSENDKVSLELEDISLKLQNSFSKEKSELELQVFEMDNLPLGFNYLDEEVDDSMSDSIEQHLLDLKSIKMILQQHNDALKASVDTLDKCKTDIELEQIEKKKLAWSATKTIQVNIQDDVSKTSEQVWGTPDSSLQLELSTNIDKICPMCNRKFRYDIDFDEFSRHVEEHFLEGDFLRL